MSQPDKLAPLLDNPVVSKPDPFTLESLIAWLRTKDANEKYCFMDMKACLICQYAEAHGEDREGTMFARSCQKFEAAGVSVNDYAMVAVMVPRTFGAALGRAIEIQSQGAK